MFEEADQVTVIMGRRTKNFLLASAATLASLLVGIEVAAYLTVPPIHVTSEGDALVVFDREIGMIPHPNAYTRRTYPAIKDRATLVFDVYTDERGARVDGPGRRAAARADIVVVGCSFSWGYALANADTYASRLAREFGAGVSNFAQPSYGTVQSLQMLRRNRDLAPKLFITASSPITASATSRRARHPTIRFASTFPTSNGIGRAGRRSPGRRATACAGWSTT